ncbi:MAG: DUF748 domain-containing protein, partial [Moorea sp. SIO2B7]|nr:DUF748 domain-containing protein [Moorena sp. SIO2B7]
MTNTPNPGNEPELNASNEQQVNEIKQPRRGWRRLWLWLGSILLLSVGGGLTFAWFFIQRQLTPIIEKNLTQSLERPLELGELERFSLNGVRFGASEIPATATDADKVSLEAVDVNFDPLQLITRLTLNLDITLVKPNIYLEQDKNQAWIATKIKLNPNAPLNIGLRRIRVKDAEIVLVSRSPQGNLQPPVEINITSSTSRLLNDNKLIKFDFVGEINEGKVKVEGESLTTNGDTNLVVVAQDINVTDIDQFLPLPLKLQAGKLDANLEVEVKKGKLPLLEGKTNLKDVTARITQLPQAFAQTNGNLVFQGSEIRLDNITTRFGSIPAVANGALDLGGGYQLSALTESIQVKQVVETLGVKKLPVPISGELKAAIQVTGAIANPVINAEVITTKPIQIDKLNFRAISVDLAWENSAILLKKFQATPTLGGSIGGKGKIQFPIPVNPSQSLPAPPQEVPKPPQGVPPAPPQGVPKPPQGVPPAPPQGVPKPPSSLQTTPKEVSAAPQKVQNPPQKGQKAGSLVLEIQAINVPSQVISGFLKHKLPIPIGPVSGQAKILATLDNLSNLRATASANFPVGGGKVSASNIKVDAGRWQGTVKVSNVQLNPLLLGMASQNLPLPPELGQGKLNGTFNISGSLKSFELKNIRVQGTGNLKSAVGNFILGSLQLNDGLWQANLQAQRVQIGRIFPQIPFQITKPANAKFNLAGSLDDLTLNGIRGKGTGRLAIAGGTVTATNLELLKGNWKATLSARDIQVGQLLPQIPVQFKRPVSGTFNVAGSLDDLTLNGIRISGNANQSVAGGTITATNLELVKGNWKGTINLRKIQVGQLVPQIPVQFKRPVSGTFNVAGSLDDLTLKGIRISGRGGLPLAGGTVSGTNLELVEGNWKGTINLRKIQVGQLVPQIPV